MGNRDKLEKKNKREKNYQGHCFWMILSFTKLKKK